METRAQQHIRTRVANACDTCKLRKIKCSGAKPCGYCARKQQPENCRYTPQPPRRRRLTAGEAAAGAAFASVSQHLLGRSPASVSRQSDQQQPLQQTPTPSSPSITRHPLGGAPQSQVLEEHEHDETEVPREARLLCDPQGKLLIFIGDCAPLSFFQTVRRLVISRVDANAFAGHSALENATYPYSRPSLASGFGTEPPVVKIDVVGSAVSAYLQVTAGLIDLFDSAARLHDDVAAWVRQGQSCERTADATSAVNYLVLAIGCQNSDKNDDNNTTAQLYFEYARDLAFADLSGNFGIGSVQGVQVHILITLYMLGAGQINGAFLFFGIAARAAYSIGIHRTAVNARFGPEIRRQRDRMWKSLRVVDLFLSTSMGRPPAVSDADCTVPYREMDSDTGREKFDLLNASAQILLITECIVVEVYSRRKISPRLTEGISRELRDWSTRWLQRLKDVVEGKEVIDDHSGAAVNGACQVLSSYYYAVILVSRPFLMVELRHRLSDESAFGTTTNGLVSGKSKLADACIDSAVLMVGPVQDLIERGSMTRRAPVIVSWLFAASLVLGLGLLGGFGRVIEKHCRSSIAALEHFAEADSHAVQYSLIAKSLLATALEYIEKRETQERLKRTESSSQLFGLIPLEPHWAGSSETATPVGIQTTGGAFGDDPPKTYQRKADNTALTTTHHEGMSLPRFSFDFESSFLGLTESLPRTPEFESTLGGNSLDADAADQTFGALNLFPLLETDGIDLANFF
ncbi:hypothetical protein B0H66DRAFT_183716 [Apodospora peruviana]|uniref:Zn(2)-C6 fungal-type domain-containing protein n=1 Tax=Apodospora peruviana TaxID=516989 RepID=A0AAE0IC27_9PEZI|nr:hypothetical protein B0H66DRAFT_183716 [Apodospora peruviana]